ncbi:helix-turn-helix domain-containing protein, partial [Nonomuraea sp. NPDC059022]
QAAWDGILDELLAADRPPTRHTLIHAGREAIRRAVRHTYRLYGYAELSGYSGAESGSGFLRYWRTTTAHPTPLEDRVVERLALAQIWPTLTVRQQQALTYLAAHEGDYSRAAEAMGVTRANLSAHLGTARIRILQLWHQGEVPSRPWFEARPGAGTTAVQAIRARQTNGSPQRLPVHGRERYYKHRCRCQTCRAAARADTVRTNDRRRERLGRTARNRLTVSQLAQVREQIASGASQSQLARQYGVHQTYISNLLRGKSRPAPDLTP